MKTEFCPTDFERDWFNPSRGESEILFNADESSKMANALLSSIKEAWLEELLKNAPVVYLNRKQMHPKCHSRYWTEYENDITLDGPATHTARLICIETIK